MDLLFLTLMSISFLKTRLSHTSDQNLSIFQCIFVYLSCSNGGALYVSNRYTGILTDQVSFLCCNTDTIGGAVYIGECNSVKIYRACFENCTGFYCPGFVIYGNSYIIQSAQMNFSSEFNPILTHECSAMISSNVACESHNNHSFSNSDPGYYSAGIYVGSGQSESVSLYNQVTHSYGRSFFGICMVGGNKVPWVSTNNFINNTATVAWFEVHSTAANPKIWKCVFSSVSISYIYKHVSNIQCTFLFEQCVFNVPYGSSYLAINSQSNSFSISNPSSNEIDLYDYKLCWNGNPTHHVKNIRLVLHVFLTFTLF